MNGKQDHECKKDLESIHSTLHSLVLISHAVFLIAGIYALYRKYYLLATIILIETVVSFIYHTDETNQFFTTADFTMATTASIATLLVAIQKFGIFKKTKARKSEIHTLIIAIILGLIAFGAYIYAEHSAPSKGAYDTDKGVFGILNINSESNSGGTYTPQIDKEEIMYLVYHIIWHLTIGIVGIIIISA